MTARALALLLLVLLLASCGGGGAQPAMQTAAPSATALAATETPGPLATATPDPAVLARDGGIAIILSAYNQLLDEYITPLEPVSLLTQAWAGVRQEAAADGLRVPAAPVLTGDRGGDFEAFRAAYVPLAASAADAKQLRFAALRTMAASLHDCHTFFLNPVASDTLLGTRQGTGSVGIGVELTGTPPLITEVIGDGPAALGGILVGDRVLEIGDADATHLGPSGALDLINGDEGTTVRLQLRRPGQDAAIDVTLTRARVVPQNIESRVIPVAAAQGGIGYARIRNFVDGGIAANLRQVLERFEAQGVTKWIIDLRGDPGGRLDTDAMSLFIKEGVVLRDLGRDGKEDDTQATGKTLEPIRPLVVLTNDRTGSVAEAFAAALQEYHAAYVIGGTTNGCVGFTDIQPLGDGSSLAVTTHVNLGPVTSKPLNGVGVIPDEAVARAQADIANGQDPQLDAAVAHLSR
jgi:carboxyl-terminal processing protease